jgi:hypothetical protein
MKKGLSKSRVLAHLQCPRRLWLQVYKPEVAEEDSGTSNRLDIGTKVGEIAQSLFPAGQLVTTDDLGKGLADTESLLAQPPKPLFEAAFKADGILVLADLLIPEKDSWRMAEVKSSASVKPYHITDAAVQTWVARQAGLSLTSTEIAHIDTSFVYPGEQDYNGLFYYADITDEVEAIQADVPVWIQEAARTLEGEEPQTEPGSHCSNPFPCPFGAYCAPDDVETEEFPVELLPYGGRVAKELRAEGYGDLREVPEGRLTNPRHQRVWEATLNNRVVLDDEACEEVSNLPYPRHYIDFETIQLAIPVWAGTRPYSQIPFQWSCHIEHSDGSVEHHEYLGDGRSDPRLPFIETLLEAVDNDGPVIVYNAVFESTRLKELADTYPALAPAVHAVIERIFDLLPLTRHHYYHPEMRGSWSIKAVLPTIAPELAYDDLEVSDGGMAMEAFAEMMSPDITPERHKQLYDALLKYCERDTWAMVAIARYFEGKR